METSKGVFYIPNFYKQPHMEHMLNYFQAWTQQNAGLETDKAIIRVVGKIAQTMTKAEYREAYGERK